MIDEINEPVVFDPLLSPFKKYSVICVGLGKGEKPRNQQTAHVRAHAESSTSKYTYSESYCVFNPKPRASERRRSLTTD